ncbi:hypothetical protein ACFL2J_06935 [Candidatus Omnitrophota bacterium]
MKYLLISITILSFLTCHAYAYFENYPPHKFRDGAFSHLEAQAIVDSDNERYESENGKVLVELRLRPDELYFSIKENAHTIVYKQDREGPLPYEVYRADLDNNGLEDFLVIYNYDGVGLAASYDMVEIYLKKEEGEYQKISYDTMAARLDDFVDVDKDGKYEVIITGFCGGEEHNYFTYSIYEFNNYQLVNSDAKFNGFPKFIWYTNDPNDKDTTHLAEQERLSHTKEKDSTIQYEEIKDLD